MRHALHALLLLTASLPALAHPDHDRGWGYRRWAAEECRPRYIVERPRLDPWACRPRLVVREDRPWCEPEREVVLLPPPPPPVFVRPRVRLWIGF